MTDNLLCRYALGGYNGYKYVSSVEIFDPRMGLWLAGNDMKQSRGYFAAPVIGDTIYAIGGQSEGNNIQDSVLKQTKCFVHHDIVLYYMFF